VEKFLLKYFNLIRAVIAILICIIISVCIVYIISKEPGFSLKSLFLGPLLSKSRFGNFIETASPIIFCGLPLPSPSRPDNLI